MMNVYIASTRPSNFGHQCGRGPIIAQTRTFVVITHDVKHNSIRTQRVCEVRNTMMGSLGSTFPISLLEDSLQLALWRTTSNIGL
jgi:hypothetical protein